MYGSDAYRVNYMWLDPEGGWSYMTESPFRNNYMKAVSLSRWEHYLMGGLSNSYHGDNNARLDKEGNISGAISLPVYRNWYIWNPNQERFQDQGLYMYRGHDRAAFTRIPEDAALLRNCSLVT